MSRSTSCTGKTTRGIVAAANQGGQRLVELDEPQDLAVSVAGHPTSGDTAGRSMTTLGEDVNEAALQAAMGQTRSGAPILGAAQREVRDAAAALLVRRAELVATLSAGLRVDAEVVAVGRTAINAWIQDASETAGEVLSASSARSVDRLRASLLRQREWAASGLTMISLWDYWRTDHDAKELLATEDDGIHLFGLVPVPVTIVDRSYVLLQGPRTGDHASLMKVWDASCLELAWGYWRAAMAATVPYRQSQASVAGFSPRQHQILSLLAADLTDDIVASALGISVRTVRADVAGVLQTLGVRSRFAAGVRLDVWDEQVALDGRTADPDADLA